MKIADAKNRTDEEICNRFIEYGFTKEDYESAVAVDSDKTLLWVIVPAAKEAGITPDKLMVKLFLQSLSKHLCFDKRKE